MSPVYDFVEYKQHCDFEIFLKSFQSSKVIVSHGPFVNVWRHFKFLYLEALSSWYLVGKDYG